MMSRRRLLPSWFTKASLLQDKPPRRNDRGLRSVGRRRLMLEFLEQRQLLSATVADTTTIAAPSLGGLQVPIAAASPGIIVNPTSGLVTTEAGGKATFTIVLATKPTRTVTIPLTSNDLTEGKVQPSLVQFGTTNWNIPRTVTITGVDDRIVDGNQSYKIITGAAISSDPLYAGLNAADVSVTNVDNDVPGGITVTPTSGLVTTESGGSATFTIVLNSRPSALVTIPLASSDLTEGRVQFSYVQFGTTNWNIPRTVKVTGVDDRIIDGDQPYTIVTGLAISLDPLYSGLNAADVSVTNLDNDVPGGITVTPTDGLVTTESGGTATFTVVLTTRPTTLVYVPLYSSNPAEGRVQPSVVEFGSGNWNIPKTVTVIGVNDSIIDGDQPYTIITGPAISLDPLYNGVDAADVSVTNLDNDVPGGITVTPTDGLVTTESGGTATFTVVLDSQPTTLVYVPLYSSNPAEGRVQPLVVEFGSGNWNIPQTVTVIGMNDSIIDGDQPYTIITGPAISLDPLYCGIDADDVSVTNLDNDVPGGITVTPTAGLVTTESGGTATFTIVLDSRPTTLVYVPLHSSDPTEGTAPMGVVEFGSGNWNIPRTVTVRGVNDSLVDGDQPYTIITGPAISLDPVYCGIDADDVSVTNLDNDAVASAMVASASKAVTKSVATTTLTSTVALFQSSDLANGKHRDAAILGPDPRQAVFALWPANS